MKDNEIKILLTEALFSQSIKTGFINWASENKKIQFPLTSIEVKEISKGKILTRKIDDFYFQIALSNINKETIKEILKRSPLFSSLAEEII